MIVAAVVMVAVLSGFRWVVFVKLKLSRQNIAREYGRQALALFEWRVLYSGLGLPSSLTSDSIQASFGEDGPKVNSVSENWDTIHVYSDVSPWPKAAKSDGGVFKGSSFGVMYSVPSGMAVHTPDFKALYLNKGEEVAVNCVLRTNLPTEDFTWWELFLYGVRSDLRCWVTIPPEKKPFFVVKRTSGKMFLEAASESVVLPFGELHLLRYERFRAMHGSLYSQELQKGWSPPELQPRVNGVLALWVEWTKANGLFEVWVLTSGGASVFGRTSPPSMWPAAAPWRQEFSLYELYVSRASWQVKNR